MNHLIIKKYITFFTIYFLFYFITYKFKEYNLSDFNNILFFLFYNLTLYISKFNLIV